MTNRESSPELGPVQQQVPDAGPLVWHSKKAWGSVGLVHYAETTVGPDTYRFVIDQPRKGDWQARGWANGTMCMYRPGPPGVRTLKDVKRVVAVYYATVLADWNENGKRSAAALDGEKQRVAAAETRAATSNLKGLR